MKILKCNSFKLYQIGEGLFHLYYLPASGFRFFFKKKSKQFFATVYTDLDEISVKCDRYFDYYFHGISLSSLKMYIDINRKQWNEHYNTHL